MKIVARFITRGADSNDGLFIGSMVSSDGQPCFDPNTVYEIREILGEMIIAKVGQGQGYFKKDEPSEYPATFPWASNVCDIMTQQGKAMFLTRKEMAQLIETDDFEI